MFKKLFKKKSLMSVVTSALLLGSLSAVANAETEYENKQATVQYECVGSVFGFFNENFDISVTISADVPKEVDANTNYQILDSSATVVMPEDALNTLRGQLGWTSFDGNVSLFEVNSDNVPATVNVANPPIPIPATQVPSIGDLQFKVPNTGGINVGFTAGSGGMITLTAGDIEATFTKVNLLDPGLPVPLNVDCEPKDVVDGQPQDLTLATIEIK